MSLFVDTSAWFAAVDAAQARHADATRVLGHGERLVTSDHVLVETWLLARWRLSRDVAEHFWGGLRAGVAQVESVTPADLEAAWRIGERFPDQDFSLADRTSFAVMERLGIRRVATFDDDFAVYRFGRDGRQAFEVVR